MIWTWEQSVTVHRILSVYGLEHVDLWLVNKTGGAPGCWRLGYTTPDGGKEQHLLMPDGTLEPYR